MIVSIIQIVTDDSHYKPIGYICPVNLIWVETRKVYNGPRVVKFISAKIKKIWSKMIFELKQIRKMYKSYIIND